MKLDLLIQGGEVVFPRTGVRKANVGVRNGKIVGIYDSVEQQDAVKIIDAKGLHVFPGVIDAHEHLGIYNPVEEDFLDTRQHAVAGITTVVNYDRQPVSYHQLMPRLIEIGEQNSYIDFAYSMGILTEEHIDELEEYVERYGLTSFKFFRNYERQLNDKFKIENGIDLSSIDLVRLIQRFNEISPKLLLAIHCENMDINRYLTKRLQKTKCDDNLVTWSLTSPGYAEAESLLSTLYLNHMIGGNIFIVNLSSAASVEVLEKVPWLTETGAKVETCPHYLTLTEESPTLHAKVGPPIHSKTDQEKLWQWIMDGRINAIGTDHVPNSLSKKYSKGQGVWDTLYGFPGAGALLPLMITEGHVKRGIPLERIADITSLQLAESFHLPDKGRIEVGCDADFAIVNLQEEKAINCDLLHTASDYTVYEGKKAVGWPVYTINRGDIIVENGQPTAENGRGRYIFRTV